MAWLIDQEIRQLIVDAESKADEILRPKRNVLDKIAEALLKEEVLEREDIERIIKEAMSN